MSLERTLYYNAVPFSGSKHGKDLYAFPASSFPCLSRSEQLCMTTTLHDYMFSLTTDPGKIQLSEPGMESETPSQNNLTFHEVVYSSVYQGAGS